MPNLSLNAYTLPSHRPYIQERATAIYRGEEKVVRHLEKAINQPTALWVSH